MNIVYASFLKRYILPRLLANAFMGMLRQLQPALEGKSLSASQMVSSVVLYIFNMPRSRTRPHVVENLLEEPLGKTLGSGQSTRGHSHQNSLPRGSENATPS